MLCGTNFADPRSKCNTLITFLMDFSSKEPLFIFIIILVLNYIQRSRVMDTIFFVKYMHCPVKSVMYVIILIIQASFISHCKISNMGIYQTQLFKYEL